MSRSLASTSTLQRLPLSWHQGLPAAQVSVWLPPPVLIRVLLSLQVTPSSSASSSHSPILSTASSSLPTQCLIPIQKSGISTSRGIVCEAGRSKARDGNSTCQAPLSFPAADIPTSTQGEPGTAAESAQRGRKDGGWPTGGLIANPQPLLQPSQGAGARHGSCDIFLLFSPLCNLFCLGR